MQPVPRLAAAAVAVAAALILLVFLLPRDAMEYLSLNVVGEPPINDRSWLDGVAELGGELSMRFLAAWGVLIVVLGAMFLLRKEGKPFSRPPASRAELITYAVGVAAFFTANLLIGYAWWDPDGFLGMGPLFLPSVASLAAFGLLPHLARRKCHLPTSALATSREGLPATIAAVAVVAFGYGLVSCIWHCCSFFDVKMYFFFFVTKLFQLWAMCSYFFMWGLPMLEARFKHGPLPSLITAVLFGICYPWHTVGFAITFAAFGFMLAVLTRRTGSYIPGLVLLYLAYIFHAGLPWHGPGFSVYVLQPVSMLIACMLAVFTLQHARRRKDGRRGP
ncbi:MAG: hypothetical protein JW839_20295 [Candidatus Lokiarchaeota archaeon]|nr:hypothetical protein [Candidatus Lokiarchaeota archaeon]